MANWFIPLMFLLFISGCSSVPDTVEEVSTLCSPPYFEHKAGECCLDENSNQVCDVEEIQKFPEEQNVDIPDTCIVGSYFECTNININDDKIYGGTISFDLTLKRFGAAVITKIDFPELGCFLENKEWSIEDGVRQTPKSFLVSCPFKGEVLEKRFVDSDMIIDVIYYDEVRHGINSTWTGVYDIKKITIKGHVTGSI